MRMTQWCGGVAYPVRVPAGVAELADATDSKSVGGETPCRFDSCLRHSIWSIGEGFGRRFSQVGETE